jgi:4-hydroxy-tetrahydrodipicolinate synthase
MDFLSLASLIETQCYPVNAKYHLSLEGLPFGLHTKSKDPKNFLPVHRLEVEQLRRLSARIR